MKKAYRLMSHDQEIQICITEVPKEEEKGTESLFIAIMVENPPDWGRGAHPDSRGAIEPK